MNIKSLISLADKLDNKGLTFEANMIDELIKNAQRENTKEQIQRLMNPTVTYIEIPSGDYTCSNCKFMTAEFFCSEPSIQAYVSAKKGCCNLFYPTDGKVIPPEEWARN